MGSSEVKYPWSSTVNVANFVTVKPYFMDAERLTNFNIWKEQMLCLLESQDLLGFINGEILPPERAANASVLDEGISSNLENEKKLWRRTDRLVKGWIIGSIGKDVLDFVWKLETAREIWLELENIFHGAESTKQSNGDLSRYLPLYKAAVSGDWETAKTNFFDNDIEETKAIITSCSLETVLHVAVSTCKANDFVNKLVELIPREALALKNFDGDTALHYAAMVGNTEAARTLVSKNSDLLYILSKFDKLPVLQAAENGFKNTLEYLISCMSEQNVDHTPFEGQLGFMLLSAVIQSEFFDVALDLLDKYPNLARFSQKEKPVCALAIMAEMGHVFPGEESFSWWQNLIYHRIPLKQSKREAAQATSVAVDIENTSFDPPVYNYFYSSHKIICGVAKKLEYRIWEVIEELVPQVKDIRNKKAMHHQALELVRYLSHQMLSLPETEASCMFSHSIILAAGEGISEIVEVVLEMYPQALASTTGRRLIELAVSGRHENVCNLIYNKSDPRILFSKAVDPEGNNLMHICAALAPPHRLNLVPGAALQMQRELQWFKGMEKFVPPSRRKCPNNDFKTPQYIFTEEHKLLKAEGEKWMKETSTACTIVAALVATVVFAAAFTVPGGVAAETGIPVLWDQFAFVLFAISVAISFFTSITSVLMFLSILNSRYATSVLMFLSILNSRYEEEYFLSVLPKRLSIGLLCLFICITFLMVAFSATLHIIVLRKMARFLIPVAAFACLPVTSFMLLQFPLLADVVYSTYGRRIFIEKSD